MSATPSPADSSLPPCEICNKKIAIYCCPRCSIKTCSLECCRSHKLQSTPIDGNSEQNSTIVCNGKRDRTKFCSLKQFSDSQLASDYHFLEDVLKVSESSKRIYQGIARDHKNNGHHPTVGGTKRARVDVTVNGLDNIANDKPPVHPLLKAREGKSIAQVLANGVRELEPEEEESGEKSVSAIRKKLGEQNIVSSQNQTTSSQQHNKRDIHVDNLVRQAELKGVNLLRMPLGMERRKSNTTKFNKKKVITWKIELCFHTPTANTTISTGDNCDDDGSKEHIIPKMLKVESHMSETSTLSEELGKHLDVHPGNSTIRSQLRSFANVPRDKLILLLKRLPCSSAAPQYYGLDRDATLGENLNGKTIIEFPTIDVVLEEDREKFPLFIGEI